MNAVEFVDSLFGTILTARRRGQIAVQFEEVDDKRLSDRLPCTPWQWTILGTRVLWFLQIRDHRAPTHGRPYQLDARHNLFPWACELGMAVPNRIPEFLQVLMAAMEAQDLGQHEAATNPEWALRGEFFNPWAERMVFDDSPPETRRRIKEDEFLSVLYEGLKARQRERRVPWNTRTTTGMPSGDKLHPPHPRFQDEWRWDLKGSRDHWWLEIVDPRYPGPEYPYRLAPMDDPAFFRTAKATNLLDKVDTFIELLITMMEENNLGQSQAKLAYDQGATASNPPWVRCVDPA